MSPLDDKNGLTRAFGHTQIQRRCPLFIAFIVLVYTLVYTTIVCIRIHAGAGIA